MSNIAFLFLPLAFFSLPAVLPFVSPSSQVTSSKALVTTSVAPVPSSFLLLVAMPFASSSFLLLVRPGAPFVAFLLVR